MFVVKGKTSRSLYGFNTRAAPTGTHWFYQKNGWMEDSVGEKWFNDVFLKFCGPERFQLLILDGHASHESLAILMRAMEEGIHILALPPHTTHYLQPLDRAVFGPLNKYYNEICSEFLQASPLNQVNKWTFPSLFRKAWDQSVTCSNIKSGFKARGIIPLNRAAIPESAFAPSDPSDCPLDESPDNAPVATDTSVISVNASSSSSTAENPMELFEMTAFAPDGAASSEMNQNELSSVLECVVPETCNSDPVLSRLSVGPVEQTLSSDCTSKANDIIHELNLSGASDVLDISDPNTLFQLLEGGELVIEPITDTMGNDLVVPCATPVAEPAVKKVKPSPQTSPSENVTIESIFMPTGTSNATQQKRKRKRKITSHRLLTSRDIINEKLKVIQLKQEKEQKMKEKK